MSISFVARLLSVCASFAFLVSCGASPTASLPWSPASHNATFNLPSDPARSWMAPGARGHDLLYVSDVGTQDVYVYSYPGGILQGTLTGFSRPWGLCVDKVGDVFVADLTGSRIFEYRHGAEKPMVILKDPGEEPGGCSVDPATGNLAVANVSTPYSNPGDVVIYAHAKGKPTKYEDSAIVYYQFCAYDDQGNLYVDGMKTGGFQLAELPMGQSSFTNITVNQSIRYAGAVQWDGSAVAVGDYESNAIYQFDISGDTGTEVGATHLDGADYAIGFWIQGSTVIGINDDSANAMYWNYPTGGAQTKTIGGLHYPLDATVSLGK